ncbi:MAG: hypothetical protein E7290_12570 [Lachnospiraceae bacterium]|nr:hypothetical protein [Lachnospiraceae bacterium]
MEYNRVNWEDSPSTNTPINAANLNNMDKGIADVAEAIQELQLNTIINSNLTVAASSFTTYTASGDLESEIVADYPYKADISIGGVTADYVATVTPSYAAAVLEILCPYNQTKAGYVRIYANEVPETDIVFRTVLCVKEA